jgi:hypothetical protein
MKKDVEYFRKLLIDLESEQRLSSENYSPHSVPVYVMPETLHA